MRAFLFTSATHRGRYLEAVTAFLMLVSNCMVVMLGRLSISTVYGTSEDDSLHTVSSVSNLRLQESFTTAPESKSPLVLGGCTKSRPSDSILRAARAQAA
jgi:hypothetical protein